MQRGDMKLAPSDIQDALTWYKDITGQDVKLIVLHPKNERYAKEVPEGITLEYVSGCLSWEVWLSPVDNFIRNTQSAPQGLNKSLETPETPLETSVANTRTVTQAYPSISTPQDLLQQKIELLAGKGMSTRAIARVLQSEGVKVSHMTVARRLQGKLISNKLDYLVE
jgi:hypothetical protein